MLRQPGVSTPVGRPYSEAHSLLLLGYARRQAKDEVDAILHLVRQGRAIYEKLGNRWGTVLSYDFETCTALYARDYEQAKYWATKYQVLAKAVDSPFLTGTSGAYLAFVALWQEDYSQAWDWLSQSLRALWDVGYTQFFWGPMLLMAQLLLLENKPERAVEILAQKDRYPGYLAFSALFENSPNWVEELRANLETRLGADRFAAAWAGGLERDRNEVVIELLSQERGARL